MGRGMGMGRDGETVTGRSGIIFNSCWGCTIITLVLASLFCFIFPQSTWEKYYGEEMHTNGKSYEGEPDTINVDRMGQYFRHLINLFFPAHQTRGSSSDCGEADGANCYDKGEDDAGLIHLQYVACLFSTLNALPMFIVFTFFPAWAYKLHFRGGGGCSAWSLGKCSIPATCGRVASANDEQSHQADQMSRLLGVFIGLTFGIINFTSNMGVLASGQSASNALDYGDTLVAHFAVWFTLTIFHLTAFINMYCQQASMSGGCYSLYQCCWCGAIAFFLLLVIGPLNEDFDFSIVEETKDTF